MITDVFDVIFRGARRTVFAAILFSFFTAITEYSARALDVSLIWDRSPDADVIGYNVYYGSVSGSYTNKVSVGNTTNATVTGLLANMPYFFVATAYNSAGGESDFSNEASYFPINLPPTLDPLSNLAIDEGSGLRVVALSGISSGAPNEVQPLTVTAVSSDTSLIPNPTITYTSPNASGTLSLAPVALAFGTAAITVTVNDGQLATNTVRRSFVVTVNPVNQAPTLNALGNLTINESAPAQTVNLSGISSGAPNELQTLTVTAISSDPALIPNPTVNYTSPNASGTLTFTPVALAFGTATITVTVNDGQATATRSFTVTINPVNQPPTLNGLGNLIIAENAGPQTVIFAGVSSGAPNEVQTLTITAASSNPGLIPNPSVNYTSPNLSGTLTFAPAANVVGTATITLTVNDGQSANNTVTRSFTVTVAPFNLPPTLDPLANLTINEGATAQTVNLSGISSGATNEIQPLAVTAVSSNPNIIPNPTVTYTSPNASGTLTFTPVTYAFGTATITVTVNDGRPVTNTITRSFTVTVNPVNQAPTLNQPGSVTINENAGVQTVSLSGISPGAPNESQPLSISAVSSDPSLIPNPTVNYTSPNASGTLSFRPVTYAFGTATITVTVNDGQSENNTLTRSFTVTVNPVNQAPTLNALGNLIIGENAPAQTVNLAGISSGATNEVQTLTITAASSNPGLIPNPSVNYTSPNASGTLTFAPVADASGVATITVTVRDGQATSNTVSRSFTVTVNPINDPPTLDLLSNLTIDENAGRQTVTLTGISSGAPNEVQPLTVTAVSSNPNIIPNPTANYTSPNTSGTLTFTPVQYAFGTATITVTVNDGQPATNTITRSFTVTVNPVNQAPTLNALGNLTINESAPAQTVNLSGISSGVPNELQTLTVTAVSSAPNLIPNPTVNYTSPNASGTLSFTPVTYAFGTATISVTVNDGQSASNTISRSFTVTVNPVNQAPTLNTLGNLTINQNASLQTVNLSGISSGATNESDTLAISAASSNPNIIPHPTVNYTSPSAMGTLTFAPVAGASGVATITVTVNDGRSVNHTVTRSFTVTVAQFNLPPTLDPPGDLTINEGASAQTVNLSGISSGAPNEVQPLTVTAASSNPNIIPNPIVNYASPNTSGTLTFTPVQYAFGTATVTVTVNDGQIATNTITRSFTVTVNPVNQAPTLNQPGNVTINENAGIQTVSLSGISSGVPNEIQTLTVTAVSSDPSLIPNPTVNYTSPNASGTLTFTPVALAFGTATITVTVNDGQATANIISRSFTVTVNPVNQPPTLNGLSNLIIAENAGPQTAIFAGVSSGAPNEVQNLTVTATSSNPGLIPNPSVNYTSPSASGTLTFTPAANVSGAATITVTVNDGQSANNTVTRTFTITVSPFNLPPTLDLVGNLTINEGAGPQTVSLSGISSGASTEIQPLSVSAVSSDTNLIPNPTVNYTSPSANGILTFAPLAYANGTATITVTVNDGQIATNTITRSFTVTVNPVNQAPTLNQPGSVTVTKNASLQSLILSGISSGAPNESQGLSVTAISSDPTVIPNPAVNYTSPNNTAILSFAPAPMALGSATISVTVNDGQSENNTVTRSFVITISEVNQPPTILVQDSITIGGKDGMHTVNLSGISAGGSNEMQTLTITSVSSNPGLIPNPTVNYTNPDSTGTLTFAPLTNLTGTVLIVVKVDDGQPTNNITVRLLNVNVVATNDSIPVVTAARAGTYNGLFYEEEQVRQSSAGSLTVTVTTGKSYTGRLQIGSGRYSFRGVLDAQSRGSNVILRTGARALQLEFRLGKDAEVDQVFGRLGDGTWTSDLWGERATFNKAAILTPLAAKYTLVLPGQNGDSSVPAGNGYGTVTVATSGKATFVGTLADGTKISHSVSLGKRGLWPLYVPLYFGRGSLLSWISFADQPESDLQGAASWIKPGDPVSRYYPGGFAEQLDIVGSAYGGPGTGGHLLKFTSGRIMFEGGNLNPVFSNLINFGLGDQITNLSSNKLTLKFAIVNGTFSGKVTDPSNNKSMAFKGAVLQKLNAGYGFLLGPNRSSEVLIVQ